MKKWTIEPWGAWMKFGPIMLIAEHTGGWAVDAGGVQVASGDAGVFERAQHEAVVACYNWAGSVSEAMAGVRV